MTPPKWITANDLDSWAKTRDAQGKLPQLLRRLIHATVQGSQIRKVAFPAGESVQMGGWDGIVETTEGNAFVPNGYSGWEMGVTEAVKGKADEDYKKRCGDSLGLNAAETTFVFVTPRRWGGKDKWIKEHNAEKIWAEVKAYDADDIEQWLELAPTVRTWLAKLLGKWSDDHQDLDSFWDEWVNATSPKLTPALHLIGREQNAAKVSDWLNKSPSKLTIQAESWEEAIAFFAAIIFEMPENEQIQYLSRCVLVKSESSWNSYRSQDSLILIPMFAQLKSLPQGHHVLVPIGGGREITNVIPLSRPSRESFRQSLVNMGVSEERAYTLTKESKQSLLVLRRLLALETNPEIHTPEWAKPENARSLIPVLLAGAWDGDKEADKEAIAALARKPYEELTDILSQWCNTSDPPIRQRGNVWQVVSREVTWHFLSRFLVPDDFKALEKIALLVLELSDPKYELPIDQQFAASIYGKNLPHSEFLRQGLVETLAILSTRGLPTGVQNVRTPQDYVNSIICKLLNVDADWQRWASLSPFLPTLAEAAPETFLEAVDQGLEGESPTLLKLFQEGLAGDSPYMGLLWALEIFAWNPDYLSLVSVILAKLSKLAPEGKFLDRPSYISYRPFDSLYRIFLWWYPQTPVPLEQRLKIINTLLICEPEVTWKLLCSLLSKNTGGISHPIYKPRWRDWGVDFNSKVTWAEGEQTIDALMEHILANVKISSKRLCDLLECLESLEPNSRDQVIKFIALVGTTHMQDVDIAEVWSHLRNLIYKHKKQSTARLAMPIEVIEQLTSVYQKFEPQTLVYRYAWIFSFNPDLLDSIDLGRKAKDERVRRVQLETAREIYLQDGLPTLFEMAVHVQQPGLLGAAIARIESIAKDEVELLERSLGQDIKALNDLAIGFIRSRLEVTGWNWAETFIALAKSQQWKKEQLITFFHSLPFNQLSWDLLSLFGEEIETTYWQTIPTGSVSSDDREIAVCKLLSVNRPHAALGLALDLDEQSKSVQPKTLIKVLKQVALIDPLTEIPAPNDIDSTNYIIEQIFRILDISESVEEHEIAELELTYFLLLHDSERQPKLLYQEISRDPLFFAAIIKFAYKAEDSREELVEFDEVIADKAKMLLEVWHQIPCLTEEGQIDLEKLEDWILKAQAACHESGRRKIGDQKIGEVLAYSPQALDGIWPDIAVREIIEKVGSSELEIGVRYGVCRKRGAWIKSIDEGGIQERQLAEAYRSYAAAIVNTHPRTAKLLRRIAESYESSAHREDVRLELDDR